MKKLTGLFGSLVMIVALVVPAIQPAYATNLSCNGKGVKVSPVLGIGTGGCIGGGSSNESPIIVFLDAGIQAATALLGLALVLSVSIAGFQYVVSNGSSDTTKAAKERLRNAVTGLVLFVFMVAILQFILPSDIKVFK